MATLLLGAGYAWGCFYARIVGQPLSSDPTTIVNAALEDPAPADNAAGTLAAPILSASSLYAPIASGVPASSGPLVYQLSMLPDGLVSILGTNPESDNSGAGLEPAPVINSQPQNVDASELSGTIPSAVFGGTYSNAVSFPNSGNYLRGNGSGLTSLKAGNLTGSYPALNGAAITDLNADNLTSGTVPAGVVNGAYSGITGVGTLDSLAVAGGISVGGNNGADTSCPSGEVLITPVIQSGIVVGGSCGNPDAGSVALNDITGATGSVALDNGANTQTWDWSLGGLNNTAAITLGETAAATGTGDAVLEVTNAANSTATDLLVSDTNNTTTNTAVAVNAASGFRGTLLNLAVNGASEFGVDHAGNVNINGNIGVTAANGAVILGDTSGNTRGTGALDIQSGRTAVTQVAAGLDTVAIGYGNTAGTSAYSSNVAIGYQNTATTAYSVALGSNNNAINYNGTAIGLENTASGITSTAIGATNVDSGSEGAAVGRENTVSADYSVAFGRGNTVNAWDSVALGLNNVVNGSGGTSALGIGITNGLANSTQIGPSNAAKITVSSAGYLGIGTGDTAPTAALQVAGTALFQAPINSTTAFKIENATGSAVIVADTTNQLVGVDMSSNVGGHPLQVETGLDVYGGSSASLSIWSQSGNGEIGTANDEWLRLNTWSNGNVAIGISSTAGLRDFNDAVISKGLTVNGSANFQNSTDSTNAFAIQNAAGTNTLLDADTTDSRVGIGTATPQATLDVMATHLSGGAGWSAPSSAAVIQYGSDQGSNTFGTENYTLDHPILTLRTPTGEITPNSGINTALLIQAEGWFRGQSTGSSIDIGAGNHMSRIIHYGDNGNSDGSRLQLLTSSNLSGTTWNAGVKIWEDGQVTINNGSDPTSPPSNATLSVWANASPTGNLQDWLTSAGTVVASIGSSGAVTLQNASDSSTALQVKNAAGTTALSLNTTNGDLYVNSGLEGSGGNKIFVGTGGTAVQGDWSNASLLFPGCLYLQNPAATTTYGKLCSAGLALGGNVTPTAQLQLASTGGTSAGGIQFGSPADVSLYRSAAGNLTTDATLHVGTASGGTVYVGGTNELQLNSGGAAAGIGNLNTTSGAADLDIFAGAGPSIVRFNANAGNATGGVVFYSGGSNPAVVAQLDGSGKLLFGSSADTDLYRSAANAMTTDGSFTVGSNLTTSGNLSVSGSGSLGSLTISNWTNTQLTVQRAGNTLLTVQANNGAGTSSNVVIAGDDGGSNRAAFYVQGAVPGNNFQAGGTGGSAVASVLVTSSSGNVGLAVQGASGQSADYLDVTANGGTAGGVFKIDSSGNIATSGSLSPATASAGLVDLGTTSNHWRNLYADDITGPYGDVINNANTGYWSVSNYFTVAKDLFVRYGDSTYGVQIGAIKNPSYSGLSLGPGTGDTFIYRASAGVLQTDGSLVSGGLSANGTTNINASGSATTTIGTGGTGAVDIGNSTGSTAITGDLSVSGNLTVPNTIYSKYIDGSNGTLAISNAIVNIEQASRLDVTSGCTNCASVLFQYTDTGPVAAVDLRPTLSTNGSGQTQYGESLSVTNAPSSANTLYGEAISITDSGSLANTVTGLSVNAANANTNNTTYAAAFLGGDVGIGTATPSAAQLQVVAASPTTVGEAIVGAASQSADLQDWLSSSNAVLDKVGSSGNFYGAALYVNKRFDDTPNGGINFINAAGNGYVRGIYYNHNTGQTAVGANGVLLNGPTTIDSRTDGSLGLDVMVGTDTTLAMNDSSGGAAFHLQGGGVTYPTAILQSASGSTGDLLQLQTATPTTVFSVGASGSVLSENSANSTTAFRIQNATAQNLFVADTADGQLALGPAAVPANGAITIGTNTTVASGGIYFGTDTNLYRANSSGTGLKTDGDFIVGQALKVGNLQTTPTTAAYGIYFGQNQDTDLYRTATASLQTDGTFLAKLSSDTVAAIASVHSTGNYGIALYNLSSGYPKMDFYNSAASELFNITGTGTGATLTWSGDTNLYRSAADTLKTDGALIVGGNLSITGTTTLGSTPASGDNSTKAATTAYVDRAAPVVVTQSFTDSGNTDFWPGYGIGQGGLWTANIYDGTTASYIGSCIFEVDADTANGNRYINIVSSTGTTGWGSMCSVVSNDTTSAVLRVSTARATGSGITVNFRRFLPSNS